MRQFNPLTLLNSTAHQQHVWNMGLDMERIPVASCVPLPTDCNVLRKQSLDNFNRWRRLLAPASLQGLISSIPPPLPSVTAPAKNDSSDPLMHPSQLYFYFLKHRDMVVVQEDKDSNILWIMSAAGLAWRWIRQLTLAPGRWQLVATPLAPVVKLFQLAFDVSMPGNLQKQFSGSTCFGAGNLPTCKPLVKRKCWFQGSQVRHACEKPGHSCFRNVISFFFFDSLNNFVLDTHHARCKYLFKDIIRTSNSGGFPRQLNM